MTKTKDVKFLHVGKGKDQTSGGECWWLKIKLVYMVEVIFCRGHLLSGKVSFRC